LDWISFFGGKELLMGKKGFTLIEMLLVVAIIGFLVAILLPSVGGVGADAKGKAVKADLRTLKSAVEAYYIAFGDYPPSANWGANNSFLLTADGTSGYSRLIDQFPVDQYEDGVTGNLFTYTYVLGGLSGDTYIIASDKGATAAPTVNGAVDDEVDANSAEHYVTNARLIITD
jgi:prepilin-type N-terminal cleavage/methylation domain-containing protein